MDLGPLGGEVSVILQKSLGRLKSLSIVEFRCFDCRVQKSLNNMLNLSEDHQTKVDCFRPPRKRRRKCGFLVPKIINIEYFLEFQRRRAHLDRIITCKLSSAQCWTEKCGGLNTLVRASYPNESQITTFSASVIKRPSSVPDKDVHSWWKSYRWVDNVTDIDYLPLLKQGKDDGFSSWIIQNILWVTAITYMPHNN